MESPNPFSALDDASKDAAELLKDTPPPAPVVEPPPAPPPAPEPARPTLAAAVEPKAPAPTPKRPAPVDRSEADDLRAQLAELKVQLAELTQKNAPAPRAAPRDAQSSAKAFGVLATWTGKGTYGGRYFTVRGEPADGCTGPTTGYFPAACVERFPEFKKVE